MTINAEVAAAREAGESHLSKLGGAYRTALRAAGREAAERFSARVTLVAAATPGWVPPDIGDVMEFAVRGDRIRAQQRNMLATIGGRVNEIPGVSFDTLMPPAQSMLDAVGKRALTIGADLRQPIGDAITKGWAEGKSVKEVAKDIRSSVNGLAPSRAEALARTDLNGLANGASHEGVRQLNAASAGDPSEPTAIPGKTWLSSQDGRVRPSHADADGQTVPFDQPYSVGGEDLDYPGDPNGSDEECMNCRCTELYEENPDALMLSDRVQTEGDWTANPALKGQMLLHSARLAEQFDTQFGKLLVREAEEFNQLAGKSNTTIYLSPRFLDDKFMKEHLDTWSTVSKTASREDILTHEFGHILDGELLRRFPEVYKRWTDHLNEEVPVLHAGKPTGTVSKRSANGLNAPSAYGAENSYEWFAEAFTDWYKHGDAAHHPSSKLVGELVKVLERGGADVVEEVAEKAAVSFAERVPVPAFNPRTITDGDLLTTELRAVLNDFTMPAVAEEKMTLAAEKQGLATNRLPVRTRANLGGAHGQFERVYLTKDKTVHGPKSINLSLQTDHLGMVYLHEFGHFLDNVGFGEPIYGSMTRKSPAWERLRKALEASPQVQKIRKVYDDSYLSKGGTASIEEARQAQHAEYLLRPQEQFARAFAQWAAKRGGPALKRELVLQIGKSVDESYGWPIQWEADDFTEIAAAIEEVLREAGVLRQELALKKFVLKGPLPRVVRSQPFLGSFARESLQAGNGVDQLLVAQASLPGRVHVDSHAPHSTAASDIRPPAVPLTIKEVRMSAVEVEQSVRWVSDIAFEGLSTGDGRYMVPGSLGWRDLPLTLMSMIETPDVGGHAGAQVAGRIDTMTKDGKVFMDGTSLPKGVTALRSTGTFDLEGDRGSETARMVDDETMRGVSVDLAVMEWALRDPETDEMLDPNELDDDQWEKAFMGEYEFAVVKGEVMAATVCPTPAFADARIAIMASAFVRPNVWRANEAAAYALGVPEGQLMTTLVASVMPVLEDWEPGNITASAIATAPLKPPKAWFYRPEADIPTPITITDEGEFYGHIALWETCHTGFVNGEWSQCVKAPRSKSGYAHFHVGEFITEEGDRIDIGTLTYDTGHAPINLGRVAARAHYDDTGAVGAFVRALDGIHGIWVSGTLASDIPAGSLARIRACPPSGDWRSADHALELIGALAVPTPGFPVPRSQLALAASADGQIEVTALILTASVCDYDVQLDVDEVIALTEYEGESLAAVIEGGTDGLHALIEG